MDLVPEPQSYGHNVTRILEDFPAWTVFGDRHGYGYRARRRQCAGKRGPDLTSAHLDGLAAAMRAADARIVPAQVSNS